jgi:hypothetical protein
MILPGEVVSTSPDHALASRPLERSRLDRRCPRNEGPRMIRLLLLLAVIAIGADAILNNGAYTQAAWKELSAHAVKLQGTGTDAKVSVEKRE